MSTEHQQYSPENQLEIIRQYAAAHNMEIIQEYSDHGRSGLNIAGREGLNQLMADVEAKRTNFTSLLVYDVSRWGGFSPSAIEASTRLWPQTRSNIFPLELGVVRRANVTGFLRPTSRMLARIICQRTRFRGRGFPTWISDIRIGLLATLEDCRSINAQRISLTIVDDVIKASTTKANIRRPFVPISYG
jgi:hypothetical protein